MPSEPAPLHLPPQLTEREIVVRLLPDNEGPLALIAKTPILRCTRVQVRIQSSPRPGEYEIDGRLDASAWGVETDRIDKKDRIKIETLVRDSLLNAQRHPEIQLRGILTGMISQRNSARFDGHLVLCGTGRPIRLDWQTVDGRRWKATTSLLQSDFGITPFTAFMGQLRSKDMLNIEIEIDLP